MCQKNRVSFKLGGVPFKLVGDVGSVSMCGLWVGCCGMGESVRVNGGGV